MKKKHIKIYHNEDWIEISSNDFVGEENNVARISAIPGMKGKVQLVETASSTKAYMINPFDKDLTKIKNCLAFSYHGELIMIPATKWEVTHSSKSKQTIDSIAKEMFS
jgi:hypothetical protein